MGFSAKIPRASKTAGNQRFRTTAVGCVYRQPGSSGILRVVNAFHRRRVDVARGAAGSSAKNRFSRSAWTPPSTRS